MNFLQIAVFFLFSCAAMLSAQNVTNLNDSGAGSLRQALSGTGAITFAAALDGRTITLASELVINNGQNINASSLSNGITLDAAGNARILRIATAISSQVTEITNVTFINGNAGLENGGAILLEESQSALRVVECYFENNFAINGGGIYRENTTNGGFLLVEGCTFRRNIASRDGGGLFAPGGGMFIFGNTFVDNIVGRDGNGFATDSASGGALFLGANVGGSIRYCTLVGNVSLAGEGIGGGLVKLSGGSQLAVVGCTIVGNSAPLGGGRPRYLRYQPFLSALGVGGGPE